MHTRTGRLTTYGVMSGMTPWPEHGGLFHACMGLLALLTMAAVAAAALLTATACLAAAVSAAALLAAGGVLVALALVAAMGVEAVRRSLGRRACREPAVSPR